MISVSFSALRLLVGTTKGHLPSKTCSTYLLTFSSGASSRRNQYAGMGGRDPANPRCTNKWLL